MLNKLAQSLHNLQTFRFSQAWFEQNQPALVRVGVLAVLAFSLLYAVPRVVVGEHMAPRLYLLGIFALVGLVVLLRYPTLSLIGIVPAAMVIPYGLGTGTETVLPAVVLLVLAALGLWVLDMVIIKKSFHLIAQRSVLAALLLVVSTMVSFGFGQLPWFYYTHASIASQIGGVMLFVLAAGTFLVVAHRLTRTALVWAVIALIALGGVYVFLHPFRDRYYTLTWPILQFYANGSTGSLFWVWLFCISVAQLVINRSLKTVWKVAIVAVLVMFLISAFILGRDWTSGWLPAFAGAAVILFLISKKARIPLVLGGILLIAFNWDQVRSVVMVGDNAYSLMTRLDAWIIMLKMIAHSPIVGFGPANYYFYTPLFPIRGYSVNFNSHNNYIDLLAQTGIIGTVIFIWMLVEVILLGMRMTKQVPEGFDRAFVYGVIGGTVGTLVAGMLGDWVIPFVYNVGFAGFRASLLGWFFMGALLAVQRLATKPPTSQAS
jgi:hypothetical protein